MTSSNSSSLFLDSTKEILERLEGDISPDAATLREEARGLITTFSEWHQVHPVMELRVAAISQLFSLYRRVLEREINK